MDMLASRQAGEGSARGALELIGVRAQSKVKAQLPRAQDQREEQGSLNWKNSTAA